MLEKIHKIFSIPLIPLISKNESGFRLSLVDLVLILSACLLTYFYPPELNNLGKLENLFSYLIIYIVFNFFLFCNVFRVRTRYELCWLFSATINILCCLLYYQNLIVFFISQSILTIIAIYCEIISDNYHGIFCKNKAQ